MKQLPWLVLTAIALGATAALYRAYVRAGARSFLSSTDLDELAAAAVGAISWAVWALGALALERPIRNSADYVTYSEPSLAYLGAAMSLLMTLALAKAAIALLRPERLPSRPLEGDT